MHAIMTQLISGHQFYFAIICTMQVGTKPICKQVQTQQHTRLLIIQARRPAIAKARRFILIIS